MAKKYYSRKMCIRDSARIQPLLRGHKYRLFYLLRAVFGYLFKLRIYFEKDLRETSTGCDFYTIMALVQVSIL